MSSQTKLIKNLKLINFMTFIKLKRLIITSKLSNYRVQTAAHHYSIGYLELSGPLSEWFADA